MSKNKPCQKCDFFLIPLWPSLLQPVPIAITQIEKTPPPASCGDEAMTVSLHTSWLEKERVGGTALPTKEVLGFSGGPIRPPEG